MRLAIRLTGLAIEAITRIETRLLCAILIGGAGQLVAYAQVPDADHERPDVDFSGVYLGAPAIGPDEYPLTAEGERTLSVYDAFSASRADDCAPPRMPGMLLGTTVSAMEIIQEEGRMEIRSERGDAVRTIHMGGTTPPASEPHTNLGYSTGHWTGPALVIHTTHLSGGVLGRDSGYPISPEARVTERYWREAGENSLQLELVIDDPVNYSQPVTIRTRKIWSPDEQVRPWNCFSLGPQDTEEPPDIEELKRLLEDL